MNTAQKARCFNPFELKNHRKIDGLRPVPELVRINYNIDESFRVCTQCRKKLNDHIVPTFIPRLCVEQIDQNITSPKMSVDSEMALNDSDSSSDTVYNVSMDLDKGENIEPNADDGQQPQTSRQEFVLSGTSSTSECISKQSSGLSCVSLGTKLPVINQALEMLDCSPIAKKRVRYDSYVQEKVHQISSNIIQSVGACHLKTSFDPDEKDNARYFGELINKLKLKFHSADTDRKQKFQILSLLPQDWSAEKIVEKMETTNYMARTSKKLVQLYGILSTPSPKQAKRIDEETVQIVKDFYNDERNSSTMPGKKDYLSIPNEFGKRIHIQKKLVLSNLKELYKSFQLEHPSIKIGFSTFAIMRPKHCILAGPSGTHTVCVCSVHQNMKLMIIGCKLQNLTENTDMPIATYQDCIDAVVCSEATENCHLGKCSNCPKTDLLKEFLNQVFWDNEISEIKFKQWITKPRASLETIVKDSSDFVQEFCEKTQDLLRHSFIAKNQGNFMKNLKESLTEEEALVIIDFAENYAFVIQDAAPGYHWNNAQATLYTVVIYFKDFHKSLVVISDNTAHDAIAVHIYNKIVIDYIKSISNTIKKIYYFSDGAPQQFKNYKNVANLCHHEKKYNMAAEWHYFATAHGKGPCDGVGGTLKREAARASLQRQCDNQITTAKELYEWANSAGILPNIIVKFSTEEFYKSQLQNYEKSFERVGKIKNLQQVHCIIPNPDGTVTVKEYSSSSSIKLYTILPKESNL